MAIHATDIARARVYIFRYTVSSLRYTNIVFSSLHLDGSPYLSKRNFDIIFAYLSNFNVILLALILMSGVIPLLTRRYDKSEHISL